MTPSLLDAIQDRFAVNDTVYWLQVNETESWRSGVKL
jgi:hypothetical protein